MENDVKVLKLVSGEEVVSKVTDEGYHVTLLKPVKFVMVPVSQTQMGFEMHPFVMLSKDDEVELPKEFIMTMCSAIDEIAKSYNSQFSDIVVPQEKRLII